MLSFIPGGDIDYVRLSIGVLWVLVNSTALHNAADALKQRFKDKLSEYSSKHRPFESIGYCLPAISFGNKQFTGLHYFNDATFYGAADFAEATF